MKTGWSALAWVLCGLFASGCGLHVDEQRVHLAFDAKLDRATLEIRYEGLDMEGRVNEKDLKMIRHAAAGGRMFGITGVTAFDLDDGDPDDVDPEPDWPAPLIEFLKVIRLERHGLYMDQSNRLCGYQRFVIDGLEKAIESANAALRALVKERAAESKGGNPFMDLDLETDKLWLARVESGERWLWIDGNELVFDLPCTPAGWERVQADLIQGFRSETGDDDGASSIFLQIYSCLRGLERRADRVILRFGTPAGPRFDLHYRRSTPKYAGKLLGALVASGGIELKSEKELLAPAASGERK